MPELLPVFTKDQIQRMVAAAALRISSDYKGRKLVLVGVLNGAFIFLADLARALSIPAQIDFVRVASYGAGTTSSGKLSLTKDLELDIRDKDVLIVEDIVDTGLTLSCLMDHLRSFGPLSVKVCALLDKRERRERTVPVDYACQVVQEGFLVGYGLDYAEDYRCLQEIYHLKL
jgi:hypoxanthine phosphoribosyltransferase